MTRETDVLVAGAGPAGWAAAIAAAAAGLGRVTVLEPREGDLDKACGEGLMPAARAGLRALGVAEPPGREFRGVRYHQAGRAAAADFTGGAGLGVRRTALIAALRARADTLGVTRVAGRVGEITPDARGVEAGGYRARWLIAADGLASGIRRRLGLAEPPRDPPRFGVRRHFRVAPWSDYVEVYLAPGAEAYVTPVGGDLVGVALLFPGGAPGGFDARLARDFPALAARLGPPVGVARGAGPFERRVRRRVRGRVLLVGDAAGYLDPLTGEGVRLGIETARAAVARIAAGAPQAYEADWWRLSRRYRAFTSGLLWARRNRWVAPRMVPLLRAGGPLFGWGLNALAGAGL